MIPTTNILGIRRSHLIFGALTLASCALAAWLLFALPGHALAQDTTAPAPTTTAAPAAGTATNSKDEGNWWDVPANILGNVVLSPIIGLSYVVLTLAGFFLGIVAWLFNGAVAYLVFDFGTFFGNSEGLLVGWGVLRDIGNILLLFGFVSIGIQTILNVGHFSVGKALPRLIIFAVLLNFSLFVSQAIIDGANALAAAMYADVRAGDCSTPLGDIGCDENQGIASNILDIAGIAGITGNLSMLGKLADVFADPVAKIVGFLGLAFFVTVTCVVLLAGALLLISRAIVLALLMITSPIGFAGMAIPQLNDFASMWWRSLLNNAIFAPAYLLLILISLKIMAATASIAGGKPNLLDAVTGQGGATGILIFALLIGFMIASLIAAKKFSIAGAEFAINAASAVTYGTLARGTNFLVGGAASRLATPLERYGQNNRLARTISNRVLRPLEGANLDLRKFGAAPILKAGGATSGANEAEHATYKDTAHLYSDFKNDKQGKENEAALRGRVAIDTLEKELHDGGPLTEKSEQLLSSMSAKDLEGLHATKDEHAAENLAPKLSPDQFEGLIKSDKLTDREKGALRKGRYTVLANDIRADIAKDMGAVRRWSVKDLEQFLATKNYEGLSDIEKTKFASLMSVDQADALLRNEKIPKTVRDGLSARRYQPLIQDVADDNGPAVRKWDSKDVVHFATTDAYEAMLPEEKAEFVSLLSDDQYDALRKSPRFGRAQVEDFEKLRKERFNETADVADWRGVPPGSRPTGTWKRIERTLAGMSSDKRAKLDDDILARKEVYTRFNPGDFESIRKMDKLTDTDRTTIGAYIKDAITNKTHKRHAEFESYWNRIKGNGTRKADWQSFYKFTI